jgi:pimeloyl-ACP methyl ester carboxylesterase
MFATHEMQVEGQKLVALALNPDTPGQPIILLHGITHSVYVWVTDTTFREHGPCYALSLPGHYPAAFPPDFGKEMITPEMIARVLTAAIRQLVGEQPVTLVGHSTGGFAVLAIAAHTPEIAQRVMSIAGFAQGKWSGFYGLLQWIARYGSVGKLVGKAMSKIAISHRALYRQFWRIGVADTRALYAYPHFETLMDSMYPSAKRLDSYAMFQYVSVMPDIDISPLLPRITAPTLVLAGDRDSTVPPAQSYLIAEKVPNADLVVVKGVGHELFLEAPSEFHRVVGNWLRKTDYD